MTSGSSFYYLVLVSGMCLGLGLGWLIPGLWRWCESYLFRPRFLRIVSVSSLSEQEPLAGKSQDV